MYPTVTAAEYAAERPPVIRIMPTVRAITREQAEERGLFLAREGATLGAYSPAWREVVAQLVASTNAAVATEAKRLQAGAP